MTIPDNSSIPKDVKETYNQIAQEYNNTVKSENHDREYLEKYLALFKPGQKILDIGAGTGNVSQDIQDTRQLDVTAVDISQEMTKLAKKNHPDLKFAIMDLRTLGLQNSTFDGAIANYSLIHIPEEDILQSLTEMSRVLKPKGKLYLALQEPITPEDKDGYYPLAYQDNTNMFINLLSEKEIHAYLNQSGFNIINIDRRPPVKGMEFPFNKLFISAEKNS